MSDPIGGKTANNLTAKTTPAETDYILMAENKITKRTKISDFLTFLKDKLGIDTLNTNLTTNISVAYVLGTAFCVYNSQFVYIHIGVSTVTLAAKDTLAILPSDIKVQAVPNIGVVSTTGNIASIAIENNIVYANPTFPQGNYFIDLVLKRA